MKTYEFSAETRAFIENIPIPMAVYQYIEDQIKPLLVSGLILHFSDTTASRKPSTAWASTCTEMFTPMTSPGWKSPPIALPQETVCTISSSATGGRISPSTM